jgi:hypothetical protein
MVYDDVSFWGGTGITSYVWRDVGPSFSTANMIEGLGFPRGETRLREILAGQARGLYANPAFLPREVIPKLIFTEAEMNEVDVMMAGLLSYLAEATSGFMMGVLDIESDTAWNTYLNNINAIGLPRVLSVIQRVYDRMYR